MNPVRQSEAEEIVDESRCTSKSGRETEYSRQEGTVLQMVGL